ncbi:MAG TPA: c-type cytochrome [Stellaceae bacterium]|nr:c-type cytochrome [Stellaceae bacterium]
MAYRSAAIALGWLFLACAVAGTARADANAGAQVARQWCSSCHLVAAGQTGTVPQGPPSFTAVAKSGVSADQLRAFLSHPHGAMPDLALTRVEIDNLIHYIESLR